MSNSTIFCTNRRQQYLLLSLHVVTREFMQANPSAMKALGLKHLLTYLAKLMQRWLHI
jgi:hypothetical protein